MIVRRIRVDDETSQRLTQTHPQLIGFLDANDYGDHEVGSLHAVTEIHVRKSWRGVEEPHRYLLLDCGEESWFPAIYPVELYEVVDPRLPQGWSVSFDDADPGLRILRVSFEEAIADPDFFGQLTNADELPQEEAERLISIYKRRVQEVLELSKDFFSAQNNGNA
ncbi:MAG: hypothetical protein ACK5H0_06410 [Bacteroidota bacterium]|jgi:hypothetical protein